MKRFFTKTGIWLLAAAATIAVVLCVVSALGSGTGLLHNALGVIASPFRAAGSAVAGWVDGISDRFDSVEQLQKENDELRQQIAELEEQMHHLIGLLKENNIATARLMKSCAEVTRGADAVKEASLSEALSSVVNDIVGLRNADEEIVKSEERNRMQLEDLAEEFHSQQKNQQEIGQMVDPLYRHVIERKAGE